MLNIPQITKVISQDSKMSIIMSSLLPDAPIKIELNGKNGIFMDEKNYDGLIETILILQENPSIIQTLKEREDGIFIDEQDVFKYV